MYSFTTNHTLLSMGEKDSIQESYCVKKPPVICNQTIQSCRMLWFTNLVESWALRRWRSARHFDSPTFVPKFYAVF